MPPNIIAKAASQQIIMTQNEMEDGKMGGKYYT
jgi:hypothetical protein